MRSSTLLFCKSFWIILFLSFGISNFSHAQAYNTGDLICLHKILDDNPDHTIDWDLSDPTRLRNVIWKNIGGEYRVTSLILRDESLTSLDVTNLTELLTLECYRNEIAALDVTQNIKLRKLDCSTNALDSLNLKQNPSLYYISCTQNNIEQLDVTQNPSLDYLKCSHNPISVLDVTKNPTLYELSCASVQITELDLSQNTELVRLSINYNKMDSIDLSTNISLTYFDCMSTLFKNLDLSNNPLLINVDCSGNQLSSLDLTNNVSLKVLYCQNNQLETLIVDKCTLLTGLTCSTNKLTELDLSTNIALTALYCQTNELTSLIVSTNKVLTTLYCPNNQLSFMNMESTVMSGTSFNRFPQDSLFSEQNLTLGETIDFSAENEAKGRSVTFDWYKVDPNGDLLQKSNTTGIFKPTSNGQYYAKMTHSYFAEVDYLISHKITVGQITSIDSYFEASTIIYPNVTNSEININSDESIKSITVLSSNGMVMLETTDLRINVRDLPEGLYLVKIELPNSITTRKFIKK
jgi:hypothetical protein